MRRGTACLLAVLVIAAAAAAENVATERENRVDSRPSVGDWRAARTVCRAVSLRAVRIGGFLGAHIDANNRASLPAGLKSPIPAGIEAVSRGEEPPAICRRLATDSDFFKWLEGACYAVTYDPSLQNLGEAIERYTAALTTMQDEDGYLGTRISPSKPFDERVAHDLYCAGHFFEAAVAHFKATGKRTLLDAACRLADFYIRAYEKEHRYYRIVGTREHPEIEPALVRLYRATGEKRYLDFAAKIAHMSQVGPALDQVHAGGGRTHAVRLCYLLTGWAELFLETGDREFYRPLPRLWAEIALKRMYVTGGIGYNERVPVNAYDLPQCLEDNPNRDIAETCASVAMMMFSWRMHAITGESRYIDTIETILYNHYLGAISRDHLANFYYNPLRRVGDLSGKTDHGGDPIRRTRLPKIHSTACCLPNAWRFFGQLPEYVFSIRDDGILVNLYTDATARYRRSDGTTVTVTTATDYPHEGTVKIRVVSARSVRFRLGLRIPAWCDKATVAVAGDRDRMAPSGRYFEINRQWSPNDEVILELSMKAEPLFSRPEIVANRGQVAFRRGPLVYCLEKQDSGGIDLTDAVVVLDREDPSRSVTSEFRPELGMHVLKVRIGRRRPAPAWNGPYFPVPPLTPQGVREATLVPFYFRANREADTRWITFIPYE